MGKINSPLIRQKHKVEENTHPHKLLELSHALKMQEFEEENEHTQED